MDEAVDAVLYFHENAEVGHIPHFSGNHRSGRVSRLHDVPGVGLRLLQAERDAPRFRVDIQNHDVDHFVDAHYLRRVFHSLVPGHFRDVNQPFDPRFELYKCAVVGEADYLPLNPQVLGIPHVCVKPGVLAELLVAQGDTSVFAVKLDDLYFDFVPDVEQLGRMIDAAPGHVGDVKQPVHAAQVNKGAVVGYVFDHALHDLSVLQDLHGLGLFFLHRFFEDSLA